MKPVFAPYFTRNPARGTFVVGQITPSLDTALSARASPEYQYRGGGFEPYFRASRKT